ncbi:hypothetical protein QUF80_12055 [Desulfococcaceae bacterium HSG8]|nr:hypothetical protein [Desulfococcaceae bacterium HSG8]
MAVGMQQDEIVIGVLAPVNFPFDMVLVPVRLFSKFLSTDRADAFLLLP